MVTLLTASFVHDERISVVYQVGNIVHGHNPSVLDTIQAFFEQVGHNIMCCDTTSFYFIGW